MRKTEEHRAKTELFEEAFRLSCKMAYHGYAKIFKIMKFSRNFAYNFIFSIHCNFGIFKKLYFLKFSQKILNFDVFLIWRFSRKFLNFDFFCKKFSIIFEFFGNAILQLCLLPTFSIKN